MSDALLVATREQLVKALGHLAYSYRKVGPLPAAPTGLTEEQLETWEGFAARFSRASDLFLARYVRTFVLQGDPAFRGSLRDFVDQAEKLGLVDDARLWMRLRELRNLVAHEYNAEKIGPLYEEMRSLTPHLLALSQRLG